MLKASFTLYDDNGNENDDTLYGDCPVEMREAIESLAESENCYFTNLTFEECL